MSETPKVEKDEAFWKVLNAAIRLDVRKGHLKWTMSELSRASEITRSLIYYYFGKEKLGIINEGIKIIGEELVGLSPHRYQLWKEGKLFESACEARAVIEKAPFISIFVHEHIHAQNEIGEQLRSIEKQFFNKIQSFYPHLNQPATEVLYAMYWGLLFTPRFSEEGLKMAAGVIKKTLQPPA